MTALPDRQRSAGSWLFLGLLGVCFFVRGVQIQCLYPPLEGPDEYQHIAYLVHLEEHGSLPLYGESTVPRSLYPHLLENPHSGLDWKQTRGIGALVYGQFYGQDPKPRGDPDIRLYQAQHPPLFYLATYRLFARLVDDYGFRPAVYATRALNIAFASLGMLLLLAPARRAFPDDDLFRPVALAASLSPMFMIYVSRVANDPLSLLFAGVGVWLLMRFPATKSPLRTAALVGLVLGLGTLTKMTVLSLLPASLAYLGYLALRAQLPWRTATYCGLTALGVYVLVVSPYLAFNYQHFGTVLSAQETIANTQAGYTLIDALREVRVEHAYTFFVRRSIRSNLWTSGWSFLRPNALLTTLYMVTLLCAFGGLLFHGIRAARGRAWAPPDAIVFCLLLVASTFLAAYAHALNSILAFGYIVTPTYYVMVAYPALFSCLLWAATGYGRAVARLLAFGLSAVFLVTEYHSLLGIAVPRWANTLDAGLAFDRLSLIHPAFPAPSYFAPLMVLSLLLVAVLVVQAAGFHRSKSSTPDA